MLDGGRIRAHLGLMTLSAFRSLAIALGLLFSTLLSAPMGSMEQSGSRLAQEITSFGSLPASGLRADSRWELAPVRSPRPESIRVLHPPASDPSSVTDIGTTGGRIVRAPRHSASPPRARPLCECLPYDANAPPVAA